MTEPTTGASPRFRPVLDGFPAYQPGRSPVSSAGQEHKLSSNESPYAPLPSVVEVIAEEARSVNRYPDNGAQALIQGARNLEGVELVLNNEVHPYDLLRYERAIFSRAAIEQLQETLKKTVSRRKHAGSEVA